jgi:hypothetical protein
MVWMYLQQLVPANEMERTMDILLDSSGIIFKFVWLFQDGASV